MREAHMHSKFGSRKPREYIMYVNVGAQAERNEPNKFLRNQAEGK